MEGLLHLIHINVTKNSKTICISFRDNGPGFKKTQNRDYSTGRGNIILNSIARQLNANMTKNEGQGAEINLTFKPKTVSELEEKHFQKIKNLLI